MKQILIKKKKEIRLSNGRYISDREENQLLDISPLKSQWSPDKLSECKREKKIRSPAQEVQHLTNESCRKRDQRKGEVGVEREVEWHMSYKHEEQVPIIASQNTLWEENEIDRRYTDNVNVLRGDWDNREVFGWKSDKYIENRVTSSPMFP